MKVFGSTSVESIVYTLQTDHDLDNLGHVDHIDHIARIDHIVNVSAVMKRCAGSVYTWKRVQIQPWNHLPDHIDRMTPTRQHELDHTDLP